MKRYMGITSLGKVVAGRPYKSPKSSQIQENEDFSMKRILDILDEASQAREDKKKNI